MLNIVAWCYLAGVDEASLFLDTSCVDLSCGTSPIRYQTPKPFISLYKYKQETNANMIKQLTSQFFDSSVNDQRCKMSRIHIFLRPTCSPYTCVVNEVVLGLGDDLDVMKSRLSSRTRAHLHTQLPLPHGSFLWWVRYTWGCQTGVGSPILSLFKLKKKTTDILNL